MQILRSLINRIKSNKKLFRYLANKLYKFFNVIERNDLIKCPNIDKVYRVVDIYDTGSIEVVCDQGPSPMRERLNGRNLLVQKFFKGQEQYRSEKNDKGWRSIGGIFANINTGEIIKKDPGPAAKEVNIDDDLVNDILGHAERKDSCKKLKK